MTLIAGLFCKDALLLCADSEENVGLAGKRSVEKIFRMGGKNWTMAIATAGYSPLCDVAVKRIREAAKKSPDEFIEHHELVIGSVLAAIYNKHIRDKHLTRDEKADRQISLIIAIQEKNGQSLLYKTCEEILQPQEKYASAGAGEELAYYFLDRLYETDLDRFECYRLMEFIVKETKASVSSVGLDTWVFTLGKDGPHTHSFLSQEGGGTIPHLSQCIHQFWKNKP